MDMASLEVRRSCQYLELLKWRGRHTELCCVGDTNTTSNSLVSHLTFLIAN